MESLCIILMLKLRPFQKHWELLKRCSYKVDLCSVRLCWAWPITSAALCATCHECSTATFGPWCWRHAELLSSWQSCHISPKSAPFWPGLTSAVCGADGKWITGNEALLCCAEFVPANITMAFLPVGNNSLLAEKLPKKIRAFSLSIFLWQNRSAHSSSQNVIYVLLMNFSWP